MNVQSYGPNVQHLGSASKSVMQTEESQSTGKGSFSDLLKQYVQETNHATKEASAQAENLAITGEGNMSETLLAAKQADLSFQLMLSARNKLLDAYREVMRMQV